MASLRKRRPFSGDAPARPILRSAYPRAYSPGRQPPAGQGFGTTSDDSLKGQSCFACAPNVFRTGISPETTGGIFFTGATTAREVRERAR